MRAPKPEFGASLPDGYTHNPCPAEQAVLDAWAAERTFESLQAARAGAKAFVFWEGPPTANGRPGIHHVLARTLKDTVCRFHTMLGERVERKAGWDTHGLPVELEVEKALGISGKPAIESLPLDPATGLQGVARFNDECRKSVWKYKDEWERLSARTGYWLDYEHPYVTYEPEYIDSVWYLLARMHEKGLIYRGKRVLPWCGRCGTGLSSHELGQPGVYKDISDPSVIVRFRLKASLLPPDKQKGLPESLLAWTTTPWTLPSNFAVAVNPDVLYVAYERQKADKGPLEVVWVAFPRALDVVGTAFGVSAYWEGETPDLPEWIPLAQKHGRELVGVRYQPLFETAVPFEEPGAWKPDVAGMHQVVAGDFVTTEDGTGLVHQAPYGADDWETARTNQMPLPLAVGSDARFRVNVADVKAGTFFKDADDALMRDLKTRGLLFKKTHEPHSYPHCWRCSTPLLYFPAPAWFIRTTALKQRMLDFNARIRWVPEEVGTSRFGEWLENNVDWNMSRDRYWGTPLPYWICDDAACNHELAVGGARDLARLAGSLPSGFDSHKPSVDAVTFQCPKCKRATMRRTNAVLDCWFDSGAMPFAQYGWPHLPGSQEKLRDQFPASYICEGLDQTRGWFYTLHAIGAFATTLDDAKLPDGPAYKTCLVNGLVLDKDGVKMSKRLGNVIDPWKVIETSGADAVRWYLMASAAPWLPKRFDPKGLEHVRHGFFATLAHSYQGFFSEYARIDRFDPNDRAIPPVAKRGEIDRWLVSRTHSVAGVARARLADFDVTAAARAIESFVVDELSNWYIRRNRRRFWKGETGADKLAAFASLHFALKSVALAMAPLAPFFAEILWQRLAPGTGSVHAQTFPTAKAAEVAEELERSMELVQKIVVMGRALREKAGIKVRQPLRAMHVRSSDARALELLATRFASEQVLDELNIKSWGSLAADDGQLCRLTGKANFRVLGKKLGARMKAAAAAIEKLDGAALSSLRGGGTAQIALDGESVELAAEDVLVQVETTADFDVETDGRFIAWLDVELDDDLVSEGLAREVVNRVNGMRKERGLAVEQRITLTLAAESDALARALERHRGLIASETLARELRLVAPEVLALDRDGSERWELAPDVWLRGALAPA